MPAAVPLSIKLLYGSGSVADGVKNAAFNTFLLYYETNVLGLPGALAGLSVFIAIPRLLAIIAAHTLIVGAALIASLILMSSMIQDTVDENELDTGERQEGVFVSAIAFTGKAVSGVGNLLGGVALQLIDFPVRAEPGTVPQSKVDLLGWAMGPGLVLLYAAAFYFLRRYRITRERHGAILAELTRRAHESLRSSPASGS